AAPEHRRPGGLDAPRRLQQLVPALHRAGPGHDRPRAVADRSVEDADHRVLGVELARRELERARDRGDPVDAGQGPELAHEGLAPPRELPDDREQQAVLARVLVWREALREDAALHAEHLGLSRTAAHDDEHSAVYL